MQVFTLKARPIRGIETFAMLLILAAAAGVNAVLLVRHPNFGTDAMGMLLPMLSWMKGGGYMLAGEVHLLYPPGVGIAAYPIYLATGDVEFAAMFLTSMSFLATIPATWMAARYLFGPGVGLLAAFFTALCPSLLGSSHVACGDALFTLLLVLAFHAHMKMMFEGATAGRAAAHGLLLGFAFLVRPEAIMIGGLSYLLHFFVALYENRPGIGRHLGLGLFSGLLCLAVMFPYMNFLHKNLGVWTVSAKGGMALRHGEMAVDGREVVDEMRKENPDVLSQTTQIGLIDYIKERKWKFAVRVKRNLGKLGSLLARINVHALLPLALVWLAYPFLAQYRLVSSARPNLSRMKWLLSMLVFMSPLPVHTLYWVSIRYLAQYTPFLSMLVALVMVLMLRSMFGRSGEPGGGRRFLVWASVVALSVLISYSYVPYVEGSGIIKQAIHEPHGNAGLRGAGLWLQGMMKEGGPRKRNMPTDADKLRIYACNKGELVLFYAAGKADCLGTSLWISPKATPEDIARDLNEGKADFLVLDSHYIQTRPAFQALWDNPGLANGAGMTAVEIDTKGLYQIYGPLRTE